MHGCPGLGVGRAVHSTLGLYGVRRMFWNWERTECPIVHSDMVHFMFCAFRFHLRRREVSTRTRWRSGQGRARPARPPGLPTPPTHGRLTPLPPGAHSLPSHPVPSGSCPNPPGTGATSKTESPVHQGQTPQLLTPWGAHSSGGGPQHGPVGEPWAPSRRHPSLPAHGAQAPGSAAGLGWGLGQASEDTLAPVCLPPCPPGDANGVLHRKEPQPGRRSAELTG